MNEKNFSPSMMNFYCWIIILIILLLKQKMLQVNSKNFFMFHNSGTLLLVKLKVYNYAFENECYISNVMNTH